MTQRKPRPVPSQVDATIASSSCEIASRTCYLDALWEVSEFGVGT